MQSEGEDRMIYDSYPFFIFLKKSIVPNRHWERLGSASEINAMIVVS